MRKKYFLLLTLLFTSVSLLTSCGGGSGSNQVSVEGTWTLTAAQQTAPTSADVKTSFYVQSIKLEGATSGNYTITKPGGGTETGTFTYNGDSKTLVLSKAEHGGSWSSVEISGSTFTATISIAASASKTTATTANVTYQK
ncbi:MAG: hypothetical protein EAZ55_09595 [Cytophagales bacterium]|nr:MAG: hypothetical protein EAZ55_09595 [Cytophagales bacterium]